MTQPNFKFGYSDEIFNQFIKRNEKINAVKYIYDHSDLGLKEAKDYVENYNSFSFQNNNFDFNEIENFNANFDLEYIRTLLNNNKKLEAISIIKDHFNIGLKDAKDIAESPIENFNSYSELLKLIDNISSSTSKYQSGNISHSNKGYKAVYTDNDGKKHIVNPNHPQWQNFKILMGENKMVKDYEQHFTNSTYNDTPIEDSLFIKENTKTKYAIFALIIALVLIAYFFFKK